MVTAEKDRSECPRIDDAEHRSSSGSALTTMFNGAASQPLR